MARTFNFIEWDELLLLHREQLELYGGQDGFVDENAARSALARSQFTAQYSTNADVADLAADYMFGLSTTQGFSDGNKRTALVASQLFLRKNGWRTILSQKLLYLVAIAVARGELDHDSLAEIIRDHMKPLPVR